MRVDEAQRAEEVRQQQRAQRKNYEPRKRMPWFGIPVGQSAKVRFLWEYSGDSGGFGLYRHQRDAKPKNVSCFRNVEYGEKDCPYCNEESEKRGSAPMKMEYFWIVYNYNHVNDDGTKGQVQLLNFRDTAYTPVKQMRVMFETYGTILDRDLTIVRQPAASPRQDGGLASSYMAIPDSPSTFTVTGLEVPTQEDVINYLRPWEVRG